MAANMEVSNQPPPLCSQRKMNDLRQNRRSSFRPGGYGQPPSMYSAPIAYAPAPSPMHAAQPFSYLPREDPNEKTFPLSVQVLIFLFSLAAFLVAVLVAGGYIKVNVSGTDCSNLGYTKCEFSVFRQKPHHVMPLHFR